MIQSYQELLDYLDADRIALESSDTFWRRMFDDIWRFQRTLRYLEFATNSRASRVQVGWLQFRLRRQGRRLGFTIPANVFGPGLSIAHAGTIVVNSGARVGANRRLHTCVNIGTAAGKKNTAPRIGDNCYIGPGAKLFGDIVIGPNTAVGANAVVNRSFPEGNVTLGGIPARVISDKGSQGLIVTGAQPDWNSRHAS